jgi:hypothetical protein
MNSQITAAPWHGHSRENREITLLQRSLVWGLLLTLSIALWPTGWARAQAQEPPDTVAPLTPRVYLPQLIQSGPAVPSGECPATSTTQYRALTTNGPSITRPADQHPDVNLAVRGYSATFHTQNLVDLDGPTDAHAPQLAALFTDRRAPLFTALYRVHDWDWPCSPSGCRGQPIEFPPVTMAALQSVPQEPINIPTRSPQIFAGGYIALVLYADDTRLTVTYTREDNPAVGYIVHLEDFCVDPNLLTLYRQLDANGRTSLPALSANEIVGHAASIPLKFAIRDTGSFMDPRSRKDWWKGY